MEEEAERILHERNFTKYGLNMDVFVSVVSALLVLSFSIFTILRPELSANLFAKINDLINQNFNWLFVFTINAAFIFLIVTGISKYGDIIDTVAVLSILFGLATSLGLGAQQINSGLNYVFGIPIDSTVQVILIITITFFATLSVVSGLSKGIKWLSEINIAISGLLLLGITLIGPTAYILSTYSSSLGLYLREFFNIGLLTGTNANEVAWQGNWTIFYWAWWIAWSPFVGTFIARISKGRTIREVTLGTIIIPTLIITITMTVLGASGVHLNSLYNDVITTAVENNVATSIFEMFKYLTNTPFAQYGLSIIAMFAITIFFITSSDFGSLIVSNLTSGGLESPPKAQRIFWASLEGLIALSVLLIGGEAALNTIQSAVIMLGLPFAILLIIIMFSLRKELKSSYRKHRMNEMIDLKKDLEKIDTRARYR